MKYILKKDFWDQKKGTAIDNLNTSPSVAGILIAGKEYFANLSILDEIIEEVKEAKEAKPREFKLMFSMGCYPAIMEKIGGDWNFLNFSNATIYCREVIEGEKPIEEKNKTIETKTFIREFLISPKDNLTGIYEGIEFNDALKYQSVESIKKDKTAIKVREVIE